MSEPLMGEVITDVRHVRGNSEVVDFVINIVLIVAGVGVCYFLYKEMKRKVDAEDEAYLRGLEDGRASVLSAKAVDKAPNVERVD